jgi:hypothetical protein
MPVHLCVSCPNEDCNFNHEPIRLDFANLEQTVGGPASWPEDGTKLYTACPACKRLTGHSKADLCDFPEGNQTVVSKGQVWIRITVMCDSRGCNTPAAFHVLLNQASNNQLASELQIKLATRHWSGLLPCGHPIGAIPNGRWYFDRPRRLLGCKPHDHTGTLKH